MSYPAHIWRYLDFIFIGSAVTIQKRLRMPITLWPIALRHLTRHEKCEDFWHPGDESFLTIYCMNDFATKFFSRHFTLRLMYQRQCNFFMISKAFFTFRNLIIVLRGVMRPWHHQHNHYNYKGCSALSITLSHQGLICAKDCKTHTPARDRWCVEHNKTLLELLGTCCVDTNKQHCCRFWHGKAILSQKNQHLVSRKKLIFFWIWQFNQGDLVPLKLIGLTLDKNFFSLNVKTVLF